MERSHGPNYDNGWRLETGLAHCLRQVLQRSSQRALIARRAPADDRSRGLRRLTMLEKSLHKLRQACHPHAHNQGARDLAQRCPVESHSRLVRILMADYQGHTATMLTVRERNTGV